MSEDTLNAQPSNELLYRYIQMAVEYANKNSPEEVFGRKDAFWDKLYRRRLESLFFDSKAPPIIENLSPRPFPEWFSNVVAHKRSDLLVGKLKHFQIGGDGALAIHEQRDTFLRAYQEQVQEGAAVRELGVEAYATYLPIHFFHDSSNLALDWGVYISEQGVMRLATALQQACKEEMGAPYPEGFHPSVDGIFVEIAYQILLRHELAHFKVESFALSMELVLKRPVYSNYLVDVYAPTYQTHACLEEALANATVLNSTVIRDLFKFLYPETYHKYRSVVAHRFFQFQPDGYSNYDCDKGWPLERNPFRRQLAGFRYPHKYEDGATIGSELGFDPRRLAMNHLCCQIVSGQVNPSDDTIPFFAFLPDNHFLRNENLVPIHIVKNLDDDSSFINVATPKRQEWERFLREAGYWRTHRGKGDHERWISGYTGLPTLTINYRNNELDFNSFKSSLKALGIKQVDYQFFRNTKKLPDPLVKKLAITAP